ncbi:MAG: tetratricopeptide repeat protein [Alphaproteobacteria bacterium]
MSEIFHDSRGLAMTAANAEAVRSYDAFVTRFMAHGADAAPRLKTVTDADPDLLLGHCARGFCALILGRQELRGAARESLAVARRVLAERGGTARERIYVEALAIFCDGWFASAANRLADALDRWPLDGYAAKLVHGIRFMIGDPAGMRRSTTALLPAWTDDVPGAGYLNGCHAFGLEETGDLADAERIGCHALDLAHDDAWAFHAVAHVYEARDDARGGLDWLDSGAADIAGTGNLAYHIAWHRALFLLDFNEFDGVLSVYDEKVRANRTDDFRDLTNGISLLVRLQAEGVDVGHRWDELVEKCVRRAEDTTLGFAALHYLMALVANDRWPEADRMIAAMQRATRAAGDQAPVFASAALPYGQAYCAGARNPADLGTARALAATLDALPMLGGSHAQRDVFVRQLIDRTAAAGADELCRRLLQVRLARRPVNAWALGRLARLQDAAGDAAFPGRTVPHAAE